MGDSSLIGLGLIAGTGVLTFGSMVAYFTAEGMGAPGWTGPAGLVVMTGGVAGTVVAAKVGRTRAERRAIERQRAEWEQFTCWFHPRLATALYRMHDPFAAMLCWTGEQVRLGRPQNPMTGDPGEWPYPFPFWRDEDLPPGVTLTNEGLWLQLPDGSVLPNHGIVPTQAGARVQLQMPDGGWSEREFAARLPNIASSLDVPAVQIVASDGRRLVLDLRVVNPLAGVVRYPGPEPAQTVEELVALLDGVRVGMLDDGGENRLRVRGNHMLFSGLTGSGKSGAVQSLLCGLAPLIPAGILEVHMVDLKRMEMAAGARLYETWSKTPAEALVAIQRVVNVLGERRDTYAEHAERTGEPVRKHIPKPGDPHLMLVIEEAMALLKIPDKQQITLTLPIRGDDGVVRDTLVKGKIIELATSMLIELLTQARAVGITVVLTTQNAAKEVLELLRDLVSLVIGLRQAGPQQEQMTFGHGARERGVRAVEITAEEVGTAFMLCETGGPAQRSRFYQVEDIDITQTVRIFGRPPGVPSRTELAAQAAATGKAVEKVPAESAPAHTSDNVVAFPPHDEQADDGVPRCLYCGKEIELIAGGGRPPKFCRNSDHRQKYHRT
ncbi:FtsK/SpoIIIE domain-containing protein [Nocardia spumae]|uniref:FtsK/SpoIIIE domain-containing protein n=1 Tax=Nocardia spumae TaxID=2887190 RepID=UPI001D132B61|nr:FtsK/SpoIIIE domain-containing protein [Nocardia spumae]